MPLSVWHTIDAGVAGGTPEHPPRLISGTYRRFLSCSSTARGGHQCDARTLSSPYHPCCNHSCTRGAHPAGPVSQPVGGPVARRLWSVRTMPGEVIMEGGDSVGVGRSRTAYDYFLSMFPMDQLTRMVRLTSTNLQGRGLQATTAGEMLKFIGVLILATCYEFGARAELWATNARNSYLVAPAFGERTGLSRCRFDALWTSLRFSERRCGGDDDSEESRWELVSEFVCSINDHRQAHVSPSEYICVDESICKWYGQGGAWIQRGLPMYVALDCKPESGCEVQNAACGRSGIMLRLSVVTTSEYQWATSDAPDDTLPHGTTVLKRLVAPWAGTQRIVCADLYFASVTTATHVRSMGLRFIGVVKTATRGYPMQALSTMEVCERGDHATYFHATPDGTIELMAVVWVDRDRRYFVATATSSLAGEPQERIRWRQGQERAERAVETVNQPQVSQDYYSCCSQIDRHNRCRQADLQLENKLITHDWSMRVNLSLLGVCIEDAWMLYSGARGVAATLSQRHFYEDLAAQLISNTLKSTGLRVRGAQASSLDAEAALPRNGTGIHLAPTLKRRQGASA